MKKLAVLCSLLLGVLLLSVILTGCGGQDQEMSAAEELNNKGNELVGQGRYDEAIAQFDKAIELDPEYADAYYYRGLAYYYKRDFDKAIADSSKVIELDPEDIRAYCNRGLAYYYKPDFDRAITDFSNAVALDPEYTIIYTNRSLAYA